MERYLKPLDSQDDRIIAYFSMEIGLNAQIPTYSGGLGILAGDTIKACADLKVPIIAVTLLSEKGYFFQKIDENGNQTEIPVEWNPSKTLTLLPEKIEVEIEGRKVLVQAWQFDVKGVKGYNVPVYFLDTNIEGNSPGDRALTSYLYGGDDSYRLSQEIILGIGGVRMLKKLGYNNIQKYHLNEGHSSLLILELLRETNNNGNYDFSKVRDLCVFTTHTPVPAGHDQFSKEMVCAKLGNLLPNEVLDKCIINNKLNMTRLALDNSKYVNGVAKKHGQVSRSMFPGYPIDSITNGVHSLTWTSGPFIKLFDKHIPGWRSDSFALRYALAISRKEIWEAHIEAKKELISFVNAQTNMGFDPAVFTIGFARRATPYKRPDLLLSNINRLMQISEKGGIQIVYAGKAHPNDQNGKDIIRAIYRKSQELKNKIKIVYLENYDMEIGRKLTSGVDLWLNTPLMPLEASGTSGMKACHNGVPNLSVLDGWWCEGHIENITGWSIGPKFKKDEHHDDAKDAEDMYEKLEQIIIPMYYDDWDNWTKIMRQSIAFNGSFFNTHRMVHQYVLNAYFH